MIWKPTNAEQMVPREHIFGSIGGVDFGPRVFVIVRAERSMLLWLAGHSYSVNGFSKYVESHLTIIRDRGMDGWRNYNNLEPYGGRLTIPRLEIAKTVICEVMGVDYWDGILEAVRTKQTLLIEGGGDQPQPAPQCGRDAYLEWREKQGY